MLRNLLENRLALLLAGVMVTITMLAQQPDPTIAAVELRYHEVSFRTNLIMSAPSAIYVDKLVIRDNLYWRGFTPVEETKR